MYRLEVTPMTDAHATAERASTGTDHPADDRQRRWGSILIALAGLFTIGHGLVFLYRTYFTAGFEAGVHTLDGLTHTELAASSPEVASYVTHVHVALAGSFVALGLVVAILAWYGVRRGSRWAWTTALVAPVVFLVPSLGVHQTVAFDYHTLVHLGPAAIGVPLLVAGLVLAHRGFETVERGD